MHRIVRIATRRRQREESFRAPARILVTLLAVGAGPAALAQVFPAGPEFQVNTQTLGYQFDAAIAPTPDGGFLVVWESQQSAGSDIVGTSVQLRRFAADGSPIEPVELQVNTLTSGFQARPRVAVAPSGAFVVAWASDVSAGTDGAESSIQVRRFAASGSPLDPAEFQVNHWTTGYQFAPDVATDDAGAFVVTWVSSQEDPPLRRSVRARRFGADGVPLDPEDLVVAPSEIAFGVPLPSLGVEPGGGFVVSWVDGCTFGDGCYDVVARRFDDQGAPLDPAPFVVNGGIGDAYVRSTDIDVVSDGDFMVVWSSERPVPGTANQNVSARRYHGPTGAPLDAAPLLVNPVLAIGAGDATAALDDDLNFVATWDSQEGIRVRRFHADGTPQDATSFRANDFTAGFRFGPRVALDDAGNAIATWTSFGSAGSDASLTSVQVRRLPPLPLFSDGFETAATNRWSAVEPVSSGGPGR